MHSCARGTEITENYNKNPFFGICVRKRYIVLRFRHRQNSIFEIKCRQTAVTGDNIIFYNHIFYNHGVEVVVLYLIWYN